MWRVDVLLLLSVLFLLPVKVHWWLWAVERTYENSYENETKKIIEISPSVAML